jgi:hypothetical protein
MMGPILIDLPASVHKALWTHLLPKKLISEEAAFVFVRREEDASGYIFRSVDWYPVLPVGFSSRSTFHFELADETRGAVIKRAHDLGASLVEFHSHSGRWPAAFSASDLSGFEEFVPHVWWRLRGRPYGAIVVGRSGFDGLFWLHHPQNAIYLDGIRVEGKVLKATKLSSLRSERYGQNQV